MGVAIQTCRIAKMKRFKGNHLGRRSRDSIKRDMIFSPPASPFNSTASLIRQRIQYQEEAGCPPIFGDPDLDQYGSNSMNMIPCCTFAKNYHDQDCRYKSQVDHAVIIVLSTPACKDPNLHLESQAKLQVTDRSSQFERNVTHDRHRSCHHGASSASARKLEDLAFEVHEKGFEMIKPGRIQHIRPFTGGNLDIDLQSRLNGARCAQNFDEIVDNDLRKNFFALGIEETRLSKC